MMILEQISMHPLKMTVRCGESPGPGFAVNLISLINMAFECEVDSLSYYSPDTYSGFIENVVDNIIDSHEIITRASHSEKTKTNEDGYDIVYEGEAMICMRDLSLSDKYLIKIAASADNVDLTSRIAAMITSVMGFPGFLSFGIRFSVYELLNNIVEYGVGKNDQEWIDLGLKKEKNKLIVSIADEGVEFDPTRCKEFDLDGYLRSGGKRGLGLMMMNRMNKTMQYDRDRGFNRVIIEKEIPEDESSGKERKMMPFRIEPPKLVDGDLYKIDLAGDLDSKGALTLEEMMNNLLDKRILNIKVDFSNVTFISSAGVGMLLGLVSSLRREGGNAVFENVSQHVQSVFDLLNLNDFFSVSEPDESLRP